MDFKDQIKQICDKADKFRDSLQTEEATKNALIMPFLSALGYDVFNPLEVVPEMTCDIGTKKGEKIDYAIMHDGQPVMLIECKHWQEDLNLHDNQLLRYFNVSPAKFGVLTNGIIYRFYTDLDDKNKMDSKPFLEVNLLQIKEAQIDQLKKFHKSYFDIDAILSSASELKYMGELRRVISEEFAAPSEDLVRLWGKQVYSGAMTKKVVDQFSVLTKRVISLIMNDMIAERLNAAIHREEESAEDECESAESSGVDEDIVTTEMELHGFYIVKAILQDILPAGRVTFKDNRDYFRIMADGKVTRGICLLKFNNEDRLRIEINDQDGAKWSRYSLDSLDDLFNYSAKLRKAAEKYINNE